MLRLAATLCLLALVLAVVPAHASSPKKDDHGAKKDAHGAAKKEEPNKGLFGSADNEVILPTLIAPVTDRGHIRDYLYIYLVAIAKDVADAEKVKAKIPFIQDAMVREVHRGVPTQGPGEDDPKLDPLYERLALRLNEIVGTKTPLKIGVNRVDTAPY